MEWFISLFEKLGPGQVSPRSFVSFVSTALESSEGIDFLGFVVGPFTAAISICAIWATLGMTHLT
jgi:hypothetical protein